VIDLRSHCCSDLLWRAERRKEGVEVESTNEELQ
jgi:hypothetical protein